MSLLCADLTLFVKRWSRVLNLHQAPGIIFRIDAVSVGLKMILDSPLVGFGFGQLPSISGMYAVRYGKFVKLIATTDNQFVDILLESGVIGLSMFLWGLLIIWKETRKESNNGIKRMIGRAVRGATVGLAVAGLSSQSFYSPFVSCYYWILVSLLFVSLPSAYSWQSARYGYK